MIPSLGHVAAVLGVVVLALLIVAPFEALKWWSRDIDLDIPEHNPDQDPGEETPSQYVVYLTGIGGSGEGLARREFGFLERLQKRSPQTRIITDVFPFSVTNNPLTGDRPLAWFFSAMHRARLRSKSLLFEVWIGAKNVAQVAVCSDPRYGPIYNLGIAREVYAALLRHGYDPRKRPPVYLVGYSGGAQVALGAACYLTRLPSKVSVVTIGGVFSSIPGLLLAHRVHCIVGSKDRTVWLGPLLFPGRWPFAARSDWNKAKRRGKVEIIESGPMIHSGRGDYFTQSVALDNGTSFADHTADLVAECLRPTLSIRADNFPHLSQSDT